MLFLYISNVVLILVVFLLIMRVHHIEKALRSEIYNNSDTSKSKVFNVKFIDDKDVVLYSQKYENLSKDTVMNDALELKSMMNFGNNVKIVINEN